MNDQRVFSSDRLYFRKFELQDAADFYRMNLDKSVIQFTGDRPFQSVYEARDFISKYDTYATQGFGRWAIVEKATDLFIGFCGLKRNEEEDIDLGFRLLPEKRGLGYATEAAKATIKFGFDVLKLNAIVGRAL